MAALTEADRDGGLVPHPDLRVCDECDGVFRRREAAPGVLLRCPRCGATLARGHRLDVQGQLALALAAAVVFAIACLAPIVTLELEDIRSVVTLFEAVALTWRAGEPLVALLALATAFAFPLAVIGLRLGVLLALALGRGAPLLVPALRALRWLLRWSMVEVFMLAVLVAVVRSIGVTSVYLGPGLFAWGTLMLLLAALQASGLQPLWAQAGLRATEPAR
ncbi:MAG: paraquat-inducible protein A [Burkholderiales bacterium]|nr:paraquat-inducible protein A [Burkholderiales bacterium]